MVSELYSGPSLRFHLLLPWLSPFRIPLTTLPDLRWLLRRQRASILNYRSNSTISCSLWIYTWLLYPTSIWVCLLPFSKTLQYQHKLQFRSSEYVYLGLSPQHKGHKCLAPTGRIYISKDVLFNKSMYPYPKLFPTLPPSPTSSATFPASIPIPTYAPLSGTPLNHYSPSPSPTQSESSHSTTVQSNSDQPVFQFQSTHSSPPAPPPPTNTHSMLTRSKTWTSPSGFLESCITHLCQRGLG